LRNFVRRDFFREAAFAFITPRFAALSIALYTLGKRALASSSFDDVTKVRKSLTADFIVRERRRLKTRFLALDRIAFFAAAVIAILSKLEQNNRNIQPTQEERVVFLPNLLCVMIGT
jgi:hypothetical protein